MCQIRMKALPKLYICIGLCFWLNFSEGRKKQPMKRVSEKEPWTVLQRTPKP